MSDYNVILSPRYEGYVAAFKHVALLVDNQGRGAVVDGMQLCKGVIVQNVIRRYLCFVLTDKSVLHKHLYFVITNRNYNLIIHTQNPVYR